MESFDSAQIQTDALQTVHQAALILYLNSISNNFFRQQVGKISLWTKITFFFFLIFPCDL